MLVISLTDITFRPVSVRAAQFGFIIWPHIVIETGLLGFCPQIVFVTGVLHFWTQIVLITCICLLTAGWKTNLMSCRPAQNICIVIFGISEAIFKKIPVDIFFEIYFSIFVVISVSTFVVVFVAILHKNAHDICLGVKWRIKEEGGYSMNSIHVQVTNMESHFTFRHKHP